MNECAKFDEIVALCHRLAAIVRNRPFDRKAFPEQEKREALAEYDLIFSKETPRTTKEGD